MSEFLLDKKKFKMHLDNLLSREIELKFIFYELFINKAKIYVVGGFIRDFLTSRKSRDLDIMIDIDPIFLVDIIESSGVFFETNRHNGIKLKFKSFTVDMWCVKENWAFKRKLVKLSEDDILHSIAKGCFYNYDALVYNVLTNNYNIQYFNNFINYNQLDILQKRSIYKQLNPSKEANILRAFYLKKSFNCVFSTNTKNYLFKTIKDFSYKEFSLAKHLLNTILKYPKYLSLTEQDIQRYIDELILDNNFGEHQFSLDLR